MNWRENKEIVFIILFGGFFIVSFLILYFLGLIPNELVSRSGDPSFLEKFNENSLENLSGGNNSEISIAHADVPIKIEADEIGLNFNIENPANDNYALLNDALTRGAVHYPGSGGPGSGNMFLFGHSTGYKVVNNKAYQVFNNIHNLKEGDEIKVYSQTAVYHYKVSSVKLEKDTTTFVSFTTKENKLTLATCNSFGAKEDRYVVEAEYVGNSPL